jgi:hypothetical protein
MAHKARAEQKLNFGNALAYGVSNQYFGNALACGLYTRHKI